MITHDRSTPSAVNQSWQDLPAAACPNQLLMVNRSPAIQDHSHIIPDPMRPPATGSMHVLHHLFSAARSFRNDKKKKGWLRTYWVLYRTCRKSETSFVQVVLRELYYRLRYHKKLWLHQKVRLKGAENIETPGRLSIGTNYVGFLHRSDKTYLNIRGKLVLAGNYTIGRGCRFDIGRNGKITIGKGGYITANSQFIIMNELVIGDNCAISWDCQFMDDDFHEIQYPEKKPVSKSIRIGNNVWIGCGVKIYKGTVIPDHCVIASNSVVKGTFLQENVLIAGNPAKIVRENITWK